MSRHLLVLRQAELGDETSDLASILRAVQKKRAKLARKLARVNWETVVEEIARRALEQAAKSVGGSVQSAYDNTTQYGTESGAPPRGKCVGVVKSNRLQVGIARDGMKLMLFWNVHTQGHDGFEQLCDALREAYKEQAIEAALQIVSGNKVTHRQHESGATIFETTVKERS